MENIESRIEDIAIGLSVPSDKIKLVYEQVKKKDRMNGDDLRQLTEMGLPVVAELSKASGNPVEDVKEMIFKEGIPFIYIHKLFLHLTNEGGMFYELKKKQSQTWGYQYQQALKKLIIEAYNAGYSHCKNEIGSYSAEDYYNDTFENHKSLN